MNSVIGQDFLLKVCKILKKYQLCQFTSESFFFTSSLFRNWPTRQERTMWKAIPSCIPAEEEELEDVWRIQWVSGEHKDYNNTVFHILSNNILVMNRPEFRSFFALKSNMVPVVQIGQQWHQLSLILMNTIGFGYKSMSNQVILTHCLLRISLLTHAPYMYFLFDST